MKTSVGERPAVRLEDRVDQLRRALPTEGGAHGDAWRGFADAVAIGVWEAVGRGDLGAPSRLLRELDALAGWAEDHLPARESPLAEAARGVDQLHRWLGAAVEGLARPSAELHLRDPRSRERAVLEVLHAHPDVPLTRGKVHEKIPKAARPSAARVSQLLDGLVAQGLVVRSYGRGRGKEEVAHYQLWEAGVALCERLGIGGEPVEEPDPAAADPTAVYGEDGARYAAAMPDCSLREVWG